MPEEAPSSAALLLREAGAPTLVGNVLDGRYRVDRVIGAGGFGTVYEGFHLTLGHPVAIKVFRMPEDCSAARRAELLAGFVEEARLLTRLRHDNIVRMLDQGFLAGDTPHAGAPYAVMELCPHGSLRQMLAERSEPLALGAALELVKGIVAGMRHAHEHGIAHRDLKPGNVMLERRTDGSIVPRIIDFGIAKLIEEGELPGSGATRTRSAAVSFTPAYAAPEQAIGGRTGMWTDVHAIGLIFCELLTGAPPYGRDDLSLKIIDPVRPTPAASGVDAGPFEAVIRRAVAIRPDERYPDAGALEEALIDAERASRAPPEPPPPPAGGLGRRAWLLGGGALAVTLGAAGFALRRAGAPSTEDASVIEPSIPAAAPSSAPIASASAVTPPSAPTLATLTAAQVVERMLGAGLAPVTDPRPDASMQQLMIPFRQGQAIGAVYVNALTLPPDVPVAAHAMIALMNVRSWVAGDRLQGYELAYLVAKHRVFSMTWAPKPAETALSCFDKLCQGLPFDVRGCSWMGDDPSADAKLTKPLWYAKRLGELTTTELLLRLEASGAAPRVDEHTGHFLAALVRRGARGELSFFKGAGASEDPKALELAEALRKQKKPFVTAHDGGVSLIAHGPLANVAFVSEVLAGVEASPVLVTG